MATKSDKAKTLNAEPFRALLERVYLSGMIEECLVQVSDGNSYVSAVDMTNSVLLAVNEATPGFDDGAYGISGIATLVRFLSSCSKEELSYSISKDGKWLTLRRKRHGKLSVLLLEPDLVGTKLEEEPDMDKLVESYPYRIPLKQRFVDDALNYISLVSGQSVEFVARDGRATFSSAGNENQRFEVPISKVKKSGPETLTRVYSGQVRSVLTAVNLSEESCLHLANDFPVVVMQDPDNAWALTPIVI